MNKTNQSLRMLTYAGCDTDGCALTVRTQEGATLRVAAFGGDTAQIWFDPSGRFVKQPSFAIADEAPRGHLEVIDTPDAITAQIGGLSLRICKRPLAIAALCGGHILFESAGDGIAYGGGERTALQLTLAENEHIVGLGEDNDALRGTLERRGTRRDMVTGQTIAQGYVTADIPVTFYMSSAGYGLFADNSHRACFDVGCAERDVFSMDFEGGEMLFYVFNGPSFRKILSLYTDVTGKPSLPPLWTQGYIQSKCTYRTWDDIDEMMSAMREKGFPIDGYVIDADWVNEYVDFEFDARWEGKGPEKIREYRQKGYKLMLSTSGPMIKKSSKLYPSGVAADIFVTDGQGHTVTCGWYGGELMDFSSPKMHDWIKPFLTGLLDMGVDAWWLDLIEPEGDPLQSVYQGGTRARIHNAFALLNTRLYYDITKEYVPACRPFILGRTGSAGIQKYGSATWTGDVYCDYETLQAHCPEALNTALSGIANWSCDTGGFISASLDNALKLPSHYYKNDASAHGLLFARWWQFSCFAPITRAHHVGPCEPYAHGPEVEAVCKRYIKLRYTLLPYIYTYAHDATQSGMGVMRALPYAFQNDDATYACNDEFLFGDWLLVAPVLTEYANARQVYFPEGVWYDFDYRYRYEGPCTAAVYAPQERVPLFVRAGAIIPTVSEMLRTDEKPWDPIYVHIWPQGCSSFTAYLDDGKTTAWEGGAYTLTTYTCCEGVNALTLGISHSNGQFAPAKYCFCVHMKQAPLSVEGYERVWHRNKLDKAGRGWYFDLVEYVLYILTPLTDLHTVTLQVALDARTLYIAKAPELEYGGAGLHEHAALRQGVRLPFLMPPASMPGKIQLENYDRGGEGLAYHMLETGNAEGLLRQDDVNIGLCTDAGGGYQLCDIRGGEWLCYTVNVEQAGIYRLALRVASGDMQGSFHAYFNGRDLTGKLTIPATGAKDAWITVVCDNIDLVQGEQVVKLSITDGETQLNWLELIKMR